MQPHTLIVLVTLAALTTSVPGRAHEDEQPGTPGDEQLGEVSFPISCTIRAARIQSRRGDPALVLLPRCRQVVHQGHRAGPPVRIGYWGIAMSSWYPLWYPPSKESLLQGQNRSRACAKAQTKTQREQDYIAAIEMFYRDFEELDHKSRAWPTRKR